MHSSREMRFRSLLSLVLALLIPALMAAQSEVVSPSAESSPNHSLKQRLEQIVQHVNQTAPTESQSQPVRLDTRPRDNAPRTSPLQAVRLPGAPVRPRDTFLAGWILLPVTIQTRSRLARFKPEARKASPWPTITRRRCPS